MGWEPTWLDRHDLESMEEAVRHTLTLFWGLTFLYLFFTLPQANVTACLNACYAANTTYQHFDYNQGSTLCYCQTDCTGLSTSSGTNTYAFNGGECFGICSGYNETVSISKTHSPRVVKAEGP